MGSEQVPGISVIVPVLNDAHHLRRGLKALGSASYDPLEIVVIDDGSLDGEEVEDLVRRMPRARLIRHQSNQGIARALNSGVEDSRYNFVAWISSDDGPVGDKFERLARALCHYPSAVLAFSGYQETGEEGNVIRTTGLRVVAGRLKGVTNGVFSGQATLVPHPLPALLTSGCFVNGSTTLIRKNVLERAGLFDPRWRYLQDYEAWIRLAGQGDFVYVDANLAWRTIHPRQLSRSLTKGEMAEENTRLLSSLFTAEMARNVLTVYGHDHVARWLSSVRPELLHVLESAFPVPIRRLAHVYRALRHMVNWRGRVANQVHELL